MWVLRLWPVAVQVLVVIGVAFAPTSVFWSRGGLLLAGACSVVVIAGAVTTGSFKSFLELVPVAWFGRRAGMVLFVSWPTYLAVPVAFGPVGRAVLVVLVTVAAMFAADYLPGHTARSDLQLASERDGVPGEDDGLDGRRFEAWPAR